MKPDVIVYKSSVLNLPKHPRKDACLQSFADGSHIKQAHVLTETRYQYTPSKLAVILGWITQDKTTPNVILRNEIVEGQKRTGGKTMCIDAGCWKYADPQNRFLRYSLDGPFYDQAEYANKNSSRQKWREISLALGVTLEPWRLKGKYILICMQRDGGFSMKNLNPIEWLEKKLIEVRSYTDRPIIIRPHPGKPQDFTRFKSKNIDIMDSNRTSLLQSLQKAHCAIFFNSSSAVASVCNGVPIFVDDRSCVAWNVANKDISKIETPEYFEREQWIYDLAAAHWSDEESKQGLIYEKFKPFLI